MKEKLLTILFPWRTLRITIEKLRWEKARLESSLMSLMSRDDIHNISSNTIIRSIEFAPEYYQAGMSILSYFNKFVNQKYPETDIKVKIEQDSFIIRMTIETLDGDKEIIEKTLESYGLILKGEMAPEDFFSDPVHIIELKQQLRMAYLQVENQRELLRFTEKHYDKRMESLEGEVKWLRGHVGKVLLHSEKTSQAITLTIDSLLQFYGNLNDIIKTEIDSLYNKIEIGLTKADEMKVKEIFDKLKKENYGAFKQLIIFLKDSIIKGSISGASGHLLYDWIKNLI